MVWNHRRTNRSQVFVASLGSGGSRSNFAEGSGRKNGGGREAYFSDSHAAPASPGHLKLLLPLLLQMTEKGSCVERDQKLNEASFFFYLTDPNTHDAKPAWTKNEDSKVHRWAESVRWSKDMFENSDFFSSELVIFSLIELTLFTLMFF